MKNKKFIYLFLALALPGLIFVFLKKFGKNEFDIPVYYKHSVDSLNAVCNTHFVNPYTIPDSVLQQVAWKSKMATVFVSSGDVPLNTEFNRLADIFSVKEYQVIQLKQNMALRYQRWCNCVFFLRQPWDIVLVDDEKKIRGYYSGSSREEFDRLILEMKILLNKY